jgi:hypothetical protein
LVGLSGSTQNQFLRFVPGQAGTFYSGTLVASTAVGSATASISVNPSSLNVAVALSEGDIMQAFVQTAGVATTAGAVLVDVVGYYL